MCRNSVNSAIGLKYALTTVFLDQVDNVSPLKTFLNCYDFTLMSDSGVVRSQSGRLHPRSEDGFTNVRWQATYLQ